MTDAQTELYVYAMDGVFYGQHIRKLILRLQGFWERGQYDRKQSTRLLANLLSVANKRGCLEASEKDIKSVADTVEKELRQSFVDGLFIR